MSLLDGSGGDISLHVMHTNFLKNVLINGQVIMRLILPAWLL